MVVLQPIKPGPPRVNLSLKRGRARRALSLLGNNNSQQNLQMAESLLTISAEEFTNKWNFDPIQGVPLASGRFQWTPVTTPPMMMTSSSTSNDLPAESVTPVLPPLEETKALMTTPRDLTSSTGGDLPNPAEDKSKDQKTCITLPTPSATASACQVTEGQASDLAAAKKTPKEVETGTAVTASHDCCPRTCACDNNLKEDVTSVGKDLKKQADRIKAEADSGIDSDDSVVDERESVSTSTTTSGGHNDETDTSTKLRQTCITDFVRPKKLSSSSAFKVPDSNSRSSNYSKKRPASSLQDPLSQPPHKKVLLHLRA